MGFAHSVVQKHNGVSTIVVDGKPMHGMTATSCAFMDPEVVKDFVAGGAEIMMIWIEAGIECWRGYGEYDWSYAIKRFEHFEKYAPDTKWIVRVRLGLLAPWYKAANPAEVHNPPPEGKPPEGLSVANLASPKWSADTCKLVADFTKWIKGTKWASRIIGFMLNAGSTEEWLIFDTNETYSGKYHEVYTREFRNYLKKQYNHDAGALQAAWGEEKVTFETAHCPMGRAKSGSHIWGPFTLRDPKTDRQAIDYYHFLNHQLADHLIAVCKAAKEAAGTPIICGGFHSYLWWETGVYSYIQEYGHCLQQKLNESPWVDFISDITSYDDRYAGGPSGYIGLAHSAGVHGKLHYTEVDLVTYASLPEKWRQEWKKIDPATTTPRSAMPAIPDPIYKWDIGYCGRDEDEQVALLQREHMHNVITGTPYWWFDIRSHNYQAPYIVKALKKLSDIGKQAVEWDRGSISEVAFVVSEDTPMYQAAMNGSLLRFEMESAHTLLIDLCTRGYGLAGVPFDMYEMHDLAAKNFPGDQYKLFVFLNAGFISAKAAEGIKRWQKNNKVMLWTHAAGVLDEKRLDPAIGESIRGIKLGWRNQRQNVHVMVDGVDHPLCQGGSALNFGTEGSIGPVFFCTDPQAKALGKLRDGGETAFAVRDHGSWKSAYLSMINFGPAMMRNLAKFSGAHVWNQTNDTLYANKSIVTLHTASKGKKLITLPAPAKVTNLWTTESLGTVREFAVEMPPFRTNIWRTEYVK